MRAGGTRQIESKDALIKGHDAAAFKQTDGGIYEIQLPMAIHQLMCPDAY